MNKHDIFTGRIGTICRRDGFTLIEMLAVVLIMAILAGLILGISGYASRKSDESAAKGNLAMLRVALNEYKERYGTYPQGERTSYDDWGDYEAEGSLAYQLSDLVEDTLTFEDPWGNAYQYQPSFAQGRTSGRVVAFDLWSGGPTWSQGSDPDPNQVIR
jgi:prepilin-type N-terminal cleavage/methylation domain-containing protein